jgi:NAD(P)-dependent dehydrogenase (short-subunit alcohol dehydrogenase family)
MNAHDFSDLNGKTCVITGGAGVIGTAVCEALAAAGIQMAITDRNGEAATEMAARLTATYKSPCIGVEADVLDRASLEQALEKIHLVLGPVHMLINGAGGNSPAATTKVEKATEAENLEDTFFGLGMEGFDSVFALNFKGTLLPTQVFGREMVERRQGVILNISSMNSFRPLTRIPAYSAAKASVNNFTQWLAVHLAGTGVRVNAIAPGFFLTKQNKFLLEDEEGQPTARGKKILANTPVGIYGKPEDLQGAVLFLLSDMAGFITGVVLPVDGGYSAFGGV